MADGIKYLRERLKILWEIRTTTSVKASWKRWHVNDQNSPVFQNVEMAGKGHYRDFLIAWSNGTAKNLEAEIWWMANIS